MGRSTTTPMAMTTLTSEPKTERSPPAHSSSVYDSLLSAAFPPVTPSHLRNFTQVYQNTSHFLVTGLCSAYLPCYWYVPIVLKSWILISQICTK